MIRNINFLTLIFCLAIFHSCKSQNSIIDQVFNKKESLVIDEIIDFYDDFIMSKNKNNLSIKKAYLSFLKINTKKCIDSGEMSFLIPKNRAVLFDSLDKKILSEFYFYKNYKDVYIRNTKEFRRKYVKYDFILNSKGKYLDLLKRLSKQNDFLMNYYESVHSCGDICPSLYNSLMIDYDKINFDKKEERLIFILPFLFF